MFLSKTFVLDIVFNFFLDGMFQLIMWFEKENYKKKVMPILLLKRVFANQTHKQLCFSLFQSLKCQSLVWLWDYQTKLAKGKTLERDSNWLGFYIDI